MPNPPWRRKSKSYARIRRTSDSSYRCANPSWVVVLHCNDGTPWNARDMSTGRGARGGCVATYAGNRTQVGREPAGNLSAEKTTRARLVPGTRRNSSMDRACHVGIFRPSHRTPNRIGRIEPMLGKAPCDIRTAGPFREYLAYSGESQPRPGPMPADAEARADPLKTFGSRSSPEPSRRPSRTYSRGESSALVARHPR